MNALLLKIQVGKLTVVQFCRFVVGVCGFLWSGKSTQVMLTPAKSYFCLPLTPFPIQIHTLKSTRAAWGRWAVALVLRTRAFAKILAAIIKSVVVSMIAHFFSRATQNLTMHGKKYVIGSSTHRVKTPRIGGPLSTPIIFRQPLEVLGVNNRILILRKWDQAVRWVEGLYNRVTFHSAFHLSSLKGLVKCSLILAFLFLTPVAFPQSTTVTLSVTDAGSQAWAGGTFEFQLKPAPQYPNLNSYVWSGGTLALSIPGSLNSSGVATPSIPSNTSITPGGSTWVADGTASIYSRPMVAPTYSTLGNCANGASPAVCASSASGAVAVPTGTNPTLTINTSSITANSQIFLSIDESLTIPSTTCNTTLSTLVQPVVTARSAGVSFTIQIGAVIATNPACVSYLIVN